MAKIIMTAQLAQDSYSPRSLSWIILKINTCYNIPRLATLMHELLQQLLSARDTIWSFRSDKQFLSLIPFHQYRTVRKTSVPASVFCYRCLSQLRMKISTHLDQVRKHFALDTNFFRNEVKFFQHLWMRKGS